MTAAAAASETRPGPGASPGASCCAGGAACPASFSAAFDLALRRGGSRRRHAAVRCWGRQQALLIEPPVQRHRPLGRHRQPQRHHRVGERPVAVQVLPGHPRDQRVGGLGQRVQLGHLAVVDRIVMRAQAAFHGDGLAHRAGDAREAQRLRRIQPPRRLDPPHDLQSEVGPHRGDLAQLAHLPFRQQAHARRRREAVLGHIRRPRGGCVTHAPRILSRETAAIGNYTYPQKSLSAPPRGAGVTHRRNVEKKPGSTTSTGLVPVIHVRPPPSCVHVRAGGTAWIRGPSPRKVKMRPPRQRRKADRRRRANAESPSEQVVSAASRMRGRAHRAAMERWAEVTLRHRKAAPGGQIVS